MQLFRGKNSLCHALRLKRVQDHDEERPISIHAHESQLSNTLVMKLVGNNRQFLTRGFRPVSCDLHHHLAFETGTPCRTIFNL